MPFSDSVGNPLMRDSAFDASAGKRSMTRTGVTLWLLFLIGILVASGSFVWSEAMTAFDGFDFNTIASVPSGETDADGEEIMTKVVINAETGEHEPIPEFDLSKVKKLMWIGLIAGFGTALVIIFNKRSAPILAPFYAAFEGLALAGISASYEVQFSGIVMQALLSTVAVMFAVLVLFKAGVLKASGPFVAGVMACMFGILGVYLVDIFLQIFMNTEVGIVHNSGALGIGFSVFVCVIAALNFVIDFDHIERGIESKAPAYMNAYCAFGILVTLVWLYLEILRLLAKLRSNSND